MVRRCKSYYYNTFKFEAGENTRTIYSHESKQNYFIVICDLIYQHFLVVKNFRLFFMGDVFICD